MREEFKTSAGGDFSSVGEQVIPGIGQELLIHVMLPGLRQFLN